MEADVDIAVHVLGCMTSPPPQRGNNDVMNTIICTKQHKKRKKAQKTAIYSLAYMYIKQVIHQINS